MGRLFCFYSDDSDPEHSQKLVYKYTSDLVNWSEKFECVACYDSSLRPGMVSVTKMGNGEYFMVYEMVGIFMNPIYCKRTTSLDNWDDVSDYGKTFAPIDNPIPYSLDPYERCGYSPSLFFSDDGTFLGHYFYKNRLLPCFKDFCKQKTGHYSKQFYCRVMSLFIFNICAIENDCARQIGICQLILPISLSGIF